ncbi:DUF475 domain-containing protein [Segnochrobactraceae bacterium EtOH-i3]
MATLRYFTWALAVTVLGLFLGAWIGWSAEGTIQGALSVLFICAVLSVLEISLSFDNAIVNAKILKDMSAVWRRRFLTWGILIAVFGMRIVFPLVIVAVAAALDPWSALQLAISQPQEYARILTEAHVGIAAFGGSFLFMVGLSYFFDAEKEIHWFRALERRLSRVAVVQGAAVALVLLTLLLFSRLLPAEEGATFLHAGIWGLLVFLAVGALGDIMDASQSQMDVVHRTGAASFLYLEVLDASFSFDGVIGAFALSNNLFVIAIGLGIGAMYVRSMTVMLVDRGTLGHYRFLEHGAFYAILALAFIMYLQTLLHIPEVLTGLIGAVLIGLSLWSSLRWKRRNPGLDDES